MAKLAWAKGSDVKNKAAAVGSSPQAAGPLGMDESQAPPTGPLPIALPSAEAVASAVAIPGNEVVPLFGLAVRLTTVAAPHRFNARMSLIRTARWKPLYRRLAEARASTRVHLARAAIEAPMLVAGHGGDTMRRGSASCRRVSKRNSAGAYAAQEAGDVS
jgi:hypothetical protein